MSWQTCIACRAGIWSHLPTLWPGWLGADWCYLACFGNQFLSATHLYPKTIVAWFRVVSCLVEKHVSGDFFSLCAESSELAEMLEELDVEPMSLAWFVPRFCGILNQWLSIFLNWISFKSSWWLEDSNAVSLEVACPGRGRLVWCLCFMSQACYTVCSPCMVKPSRWLQKWTRLPGSCDSCGTWKVEVPDKYHRKTWDLTSIPSANPWSYMWKWPTYNL